MGKDVIIACDFASAEQTFAFLDKITGKKPDPKYEGYVHGAFMILLLVLWLSAVATVTLAVRERRFAAYPILAVVAAALFALWRLGAAFSSVFRFHRKREMVPLLAKAVSLSSATVSLFGLQATLLSRGGISKALRFRLNTAGGVFVGIFTVGNSQQRDDFNYDACQCGQNLRKLEHAGGELSRLFFAGCGLCWV